MRASAVDITRARRELGFEPLVFLEVGLKVELDCRKAMLETPVLGFVN